MNRRRAGLIALVLGVSGLHLLLLPQLWPARLGDGAAADARPARMQVSFVQALAPAEPPARRLRPARPLTRTVARAAALPVPAEPVAPLAAIESLPELVPLPEPAPAEAPVAAASAAASAVAAAASTPADGAVDATAFDWPPSTRLSYQLTGEFQGPVEGSASVEWLRKGLRYQVHLDLSVALLASRRISSDGVITPQGLAPRRYDEETRVVLREPRRVAIDFGDQELRLADGRQVPRPEGVQDSASQFVQMTWLFNARPELLQPGRSVAFPLALPRRVEIWTYDIGTLESVQTPAGALPAVRVQPRREAGGGDLTVEFWVAPSLQHLPVRLLIRQQRGVFLDLRLLRLPEQEAPPR